MQLFLGPARPKQLPVHVAWDPVERINTLGAATAV